MGSTDGLVSITEQAMRRALGRPDPDRPPRRQRRAEQIVEAKRLREARRAAFRG